MMCHAAVKTAMSIDGENLTDEMPAAGAEVAEIAFQGIGRKTERKGS